MSLEIERKYLVKDDSYKRLASHSCDIRQGYLSRDPERTVRVRTIDGQGYITIKGQSSRDGLIRFEWEKEITIDEALSLLKLALPGIIHKTRFFYMYEGHEWTTDLFYEENEGLVMSEIELDTPDQKFDKPSFIGEEVTGDTRYYNSYLIQHPYTSWKHE